MEKTLVLLKPCTLQRGLVGEVINRFEKRGLRLAGMKMMQLTDAILDEHYARAIILSEFKGFHDVNSRDCMLLRRY